MTAAKDNRLALLQCIMGIEKALAHSHLLTEDALQEEFRVFRGRLMQLNPSIPKLCKGAPLRNADESAINPLLYTARGGVEDLVAAAVIDNGFRSTFQQVQFCSQCDRVNVQDGQSTDMWVLPAGTTWGEDGMLACFIEYSRCASCRSRTAYITSRIPSTWPSVLLFHKSNDAVGESPPMLFCAPGGPVYRAKALQYHGRAHYISGMLNSARHPNWLLRANDFPPAPEARMKLIPLDGSDRDQIPLRVEDYGLTHVYYERERESTVAESQNAPQEWRDILATRQRAMMTYRQAINNKARRQNTVVLD